MDWQQLASLLIVGLTAILLVRHEWRRHQRAKLRLCGGDCGCAASRTVEEFRTRAQPRLGEK